ncbi:MULTISPECIES: hypothetical protein [unclassified Imperialibacter]|uniref:hypothetical protein n=1 Tax=unclassified Imperialibacter TaxID=2629706 RepID=UPI00125F4F68|nr:MULTISPECIES: hypothetical protein [unclassified Imperialibacter]
MKKKDIIIVFILNLQHNYCIFTLKEKVRKMPYFNLKELKAQLPKGYTSKVATLADCTERRVIRFFKGELYDTQIHWAALEVVEEFKKEEAH